MSSGAQVTTAYAKQTDKDTTPTSGWKYLPNKTNGLTNSIELANSELTTGNRVARAGMPTGGQVSGEIASELMYGTFDDLISAAFWSNWVDDATDAKKSTLEISDVRTMFAVTKDFNDVNVHHLFNGCHVNSFKFEVTTDGIASVNFGLMGLGYQERTTTSFSKTPTDAVTTKPASGQSIGDIKIEGALLDTCIESISFNLDNQAEVQKCLGDNKYGGNILAMLANATGSMTIAYSQEAHALLSAQLTGNTISIEVPIKFDEGNYILSIPKAQVKGEIPSPSGTDLVKADIEYTVVDESPVIIRQAA